MEADSKRKLKSRKIEGGHGFKHPWNERLHLRLAAAKAGNPPGALKEERARGALGSRAGDPGWTSPRFTDDGRATGFPCLSSRSSASALERNRNAG